MTELRGDVVVLRPMRLDDVPRVAAVQAQPGVASRWGPPEEAELCAKAAGTDGSTVFVIEIDAEVVGLIQYHEEDDPMYRHAGIDVFLSEHLHGRGIGTDAVRVMARHLIADRGHHRLVIDPAADNHAAIRAYQKVGFRPVGVLRRYERLPGGEWHDGLLMDLLAEDLPAVGDGEHDVEVLAGGVANAGAVVRVGSHVLRPSNAHTTTIHRFLNQLQEVGFAGAPCPVRVDPDGRERLGFVPGDVAIPPYPSWAQTDMALASVAELLRGLHDASARIDTAVSGWSREMADPQGGPVVCHNDVCLENVVFRDGVAVALLDFDFAAPGRPAFDLACFARMCVPVDDDVSATNLGWQPADRPGRLRLVCDAYGLDAGGRDQVLSILDESIARGGEFVKRRVEAGEPGFVQMWAQMGGMARFDRRRTWWAHQRPAFKAALASS